jgi:endonuclease/exonuclease/phosphatase family metal-dependent hydrolase
MRICLILFLSLLSLQATAREFTVLVYNVEHLFDLDGIAIIEEYEQPPHGNYGIPQLINKLESIRRTLTEVNLDHGPDVILFQEFELDLTPFRGPDPQDFLAEHRDTPLAELLQQDRSARLLSADLLLLKYLDDHGISGYHIAKPDTLAMDSHSIHKNVVFSRFPITYVRNEPKLNARDLLEVGIDVDGHEVIVLNNHWKSGASNPEMEPIRIQNAMVVRARLDSILLRNPRADVIVGGDLNAYYNHKAAFPDLSQTAVNDILRSAGYESRMLDLNTRMLYNLWFELPQEERGSEVWRGRWGTLMQMLLTPGLYDNRGIQYIDNSFRRLIIPGFNVDSTWQRPRRWANIGDGSGASDHLPILARFRVADPQNDDWMALSNPTNEDLTDFLPAVDYSTIDRAQIPTADFLNDLPDSELAAQRGELFIINQPLSSLNPPSVRLGNREVQIFSPVPAVRNALERAMPNDRINAVVELDYWRGNIQWAIRHASWVTAPEVRE